ncbi:LD-carboxypeptidase [Streptomyces sp. NPDC046821]|uniref:LD-carboxypeptidase n=1 Tax=Streptomyces sp. NPDC046821 TaxID=3154702 RepID=UPI0033C3AD7B
MRIVSPASPPSRGGVARGVELLKSWGLRVDLGEHVFDRWGYMAGRDEDRGNPDGSAGRRLTSTASLSVEGPRGGD